MPLKVETWDPAEAAHEGAALCDAKRPDWYRHIDKDLLDLADCSVCVLGQLGGEFAERPYGLMLDEWGITEARETSRLGFDAPSVVETGAWVGSYDGLGRRYSALTEAWIEEVNQRLARDETATEAPAASLP